MLRTLLIVFGLVEIVMPRPVIEACERIGPENPEDVDRRPRALWGARLEGLLFIWVLARRESGRRPVNALLALVGLVLVALPQPVIELSQRVVYANTADLELRSWVTPAARALGGLYLLVALLSGRTDPDEVVAEAPDGETVTVSDSHNSL